MSVTPSTLRALLPADNAKWLSVVRGASGATVLHDPLRDRYAKVLLAPQADGLVTERDRIAWLSSTDIPSASLLDWRVTKTGGCLITRAVPGVPADRLTADALKCAWPAIIDVVRELHSIPVGQCPFDGGLATMMPVARAIVAENRVHAEFLPKELQGISPTAILTELEEELPERLAQERTERVVCHGDLCLPNVLIDPDTSEVTGLIDLGRLGHADPYVDIAVLLASAREIWPDETTARRADHDFAQQYGIDLSPGRLWFYRRLDPLTW